MSFEASWGHLWALGAYLEFLGGFLMAFGGILEGSWGRLGGLLEVLDAKLELDIVLFGFHFPGGSS